MVIKILIYIHSRMTAMASHLCSTIFTEIFRSLAFRYSYNHLRWRKNKQSLECDERLTRKASYCFMAHQRPQDAAKAEKRTRAPEIIPRLSICCPWSGR